MKPGDLVRTDVPFAPNHNRLGIVVYVDKSLKLFPNDRSYYGVLMDSGEILNFRYEQLIESSDGYFSRDEYYKVAQ